MNQLNISCNDSSLWITILNVEFACLIRDYENVVIQWQIEQLHWLGPKRQLLTKPFLDRFSIN